MCMLLLPNKVMIIVQLLVYKKLIFNPININSYYINGFISRNHKSSDLFYK